MPRIFTKGKHSLIPAVAPDTVLRTEKLPLFGFRARVILPKKRFPPDFHQSQMPISANIQHTQTRLSSVNVLEAAESIQIQLLCTSPLLS